MTNEGLIAARQSYANYDLEKKTKAQLRAQGAQILFDKEFVKDLLPIPSCPWKINTHVSCWFKIFSTEFFIFFEQKISFIIN